MIPITITLLISVGYQSIPYITIKIGFRAIVSITISSTTVNFIININNSGFSR